MNRADIERAKKANRREREKLVELRAELDAYARKIDAEALRNARNRTAWVREREAAIVALRALTARFGATGWSDDTPLAEILEIFLREPLEDMVMRVNRHMDRLRDETRPKPPPIGPPRPLRASQLHELEIVPVSEQGVHGYRAACACGWRSTRCGREADAVERGGNHRAYLANQPAGGGA